MTAPAAEPVTLVDAKAQLNAPTDFTDDDGFISSQIIAARQYCENVMQRAIFNRSVQFTCDNFPYPEFTSTVNPVDRHCLYGQYWHQLAINLPFPNCVSVESITYLDQNAASQTVDPATYFVDVNSEPARIVPIPGLYWPYAQSFLPGSVKVTFTAGSYGDGVDVDTCPQTIRQAILLLVSYWYGHRDAAESTPSKEVALGVDNLLTPYKFDTFGLVR
ncbi:MAG TPA: head-tail connector protein [Terracidiphilus sp.]